MFIMPNDVSDGYYQSAAPKISDWGKVVNCRPGLYFRPTSIAALQQFLTDQLQSGTAVTNLRILGGLHSCSEIFSGDIVVDPSALPKTLDWDAGNTGVTAAANIHLHDFLLALSLRGKSLSATGGTDAQMLAGLISTNTAGATIHHSIYELLDWVEFLSVAADGKSMQLRKIANGSPDFNAAVCSLGLMGFITRVHFRTIDTPYYKVTQSIVAIDTVVKDPLHTSTLYDFWRIEWIPDTDHGLLWTANGIPAKDAKPDGDYPADGTETILKYLGFISDRLEHAGPFLNESLKLAYFAMREAHKASTLTGPLRNMIPVDRTAPVRVAQAEWCFCPADLGAAMTVCRNYFSASKWPNTPIEIELTRTDSYLMSAWNWPGLPAIAKFNFQYLTDYMTPADLAAAMNHLQGLWAAFEAAGLTFKAHWGKINFLDAQFVGQHYELRAFKPYIQPMFLNDSLRARLL
jgi:hypothetical protein